MIGGLLSPFLFYYVYKSNTLNNWSNVLKYNVVGLFGLLLLFSFRGRIELNWLITAAFPLLALSYPVLEKRLNPWVKATTILSIVTLLIIRVMLVLSIAPDIGELKDYNGYEKWANDLHQKFPNKKIVFIDNYQLPSLYWFYTEEKSFAHNTLGSRINQYNYWDQDKYFTNADVVMLERWQTWMTGADTIQTSRGVFAVQSTNDFLAINRLWLTLDEYFFYPKSRRYNRYRI